MEVEISNSLEGVRTSEEGVIKADELIRQAVAIGAGISGVAGINFLPPEIRRERERAVRRAFVKAAVSAGLTVMALIFVGMRIQLASLNKKIAAAKFELSALQQSFGSPEYWSVISGILKNTPYCEDVLKEISNVIPQGIYLHELKMQGRICFLRGAVTSLDNPEEALSDFIRHLELGIFKNAKSVNIKDGLGVKEFEFQIECE